ncbi:Zinc finger transcription factor YRR1 [Smittium mucronatum]|uniref:Zinc finger transcription factor YRR1 n=1 Tax=Smittium mucronatum TaxID=133383 RepID=A0A1R0H968_9FUNG|nr:Zinc finger transcription factor YRR1 [Smittium mucronatum]
MSGNKLKRKSGPKFGDRMNSFRSTDEKNKKEKKDNNPINSNNASTSAKIPTLGKNLYTCYFCRKRKIRCDSIRPTCGACQQRNEMCIYEEYNIGEDMKYGFDALERKISRARLALEKIKKFPSSEDSFQPSEKANLLNMNTNLSLLLKKESLDGEDLADHEDNGSTISPAFDYELAEKTSTLELGCAEVEDDVFIEVINKLSRSFIIYYIISRHYFIQRVKSNTMPDILKYTLLLSGAKLLDNPIFFKDHLYISGHNYANIALGILLNSMSVINVDKVLSIGLLVVHYIGISKLETAVSLIRESISFLFFFTNSPPPLSPIRIND